MATLISINSRDLPYTIDTYGMFTGEGVDESEADYYRDELGYTGEIDFDYNHAGIVEALSGWSIAIIEQAVHDGDIVIGCPIIKKHASPQFYNYTTDSYTADWSIDTGKLSAFCHANGVEWNAWLPTSGWDVSDFADTDNGYVAMLEFYLLQQLTVDDYNEQMWEHESECYYENMKPSAEMQAELDKLEDAKND